jgi:hypothetical protein
MTGPDRSDWPWHSAPDDVDDYDVAAWHAIRHTSGGVLPGQSLERWVQRQRASRDVWQWLEPEPLTEAQHEQLRVDLVEAWNAAATRPLRPRFAGRLPR